MDLTSPTSPLAGTWQLQFGTTGHDVAYAIDAVQRGVYLGGETSGEIPGCMPACHQHGDLDAWWVQIH